MVIGLTSGLPVKQQSQIKNYKNNNKFEKSSNK